MDRSARPACNQTAKPGRQDCAPASRPPPTRRWAGRISAARSPSIPTRTWPSRSASPTAPSTKNSGRRTRPMARGPKSCADETETGRVSGFFDFLKTLPPYDDNANTVYRLEQRRRLIIEPFAPQIEGARVLDIAAHDGRWSYALAHAGAAEVVGVEARAELVARFDAFPETAFKPR